MKFLNTQYPLLFDGTVGNVTSGDNSIYIPNTSDSVYCTKTISSTTSLYIKVFVKTNTDSNLRCVLDVKTNGGNNLQLYESNSQLELAMTTGNTVFWVDSVPATSSGSLHERTLYLHIDTTENTVDLYSDGIKYASVSAGFSGESISEVRLGKMGTYYWEILYFNQIIIADTAFPLTEAISEVSPTITSTDWTVSSGVATTDSIGSSMTLTAPSGSINETTRIVTGYSVAFLDASSTETINALNVTQGATTKQVLLPSSGAVETSDTFTASQLSSISATVTSAYVSS